MLDASTVAPRPATWVWILLRVRYRGRCSGWLGIATEVSGGLDDVDGNKRTAYVLCRTFMVVNDWDIARSLAERYPVMISLASGEMSEAAFAEWLREHARPDPISEPAPAYG